MVLQNRHKRLASAKARARKGLPPSSRRDDALVEAEHYASGDDLAEAASSVDTADDAPASTARPDADSATASDALPEPDPEEAAFERASS